MIKRIITITAIILLSFSVVGQDKKDTVIQITLTYADYKKLIYSIDAAIDSKAKTNEIIAWMDARTVIIPPKQDSVTNKTQPKK